MVSGPPQSGAGGVHAHHFGERQTGECLCQRRRRRRSALRNLQKEDFRIYEDDIEQKLAVFERESGLPLSIAMALDTSMSTRKDLPLEIASARKFAHAMLRPVDSIALYQFSTYVSQALPFTNDERRLDDALEPSANRRGHGCSTTPSSSAPRRCSGGRAAKSSSSSPTAATRPARPITRRRCARRRSPRPSSTPSSWCPSRPTPGATLAASTP